MGMQPRPRTWGTELLRFASFDTILENYEEKVDVIQQINSREKLRNEARARSDPVSNEGTLYDDDVMIQVISGSILVFDLGH